MFTGEQRSGFDAGPGGNPSSFCCSFFLEGEEIRLFVTMLTLV